ncbi:cytochrome P450 [Leptolyngbya sp. NK1-12]|uniref:Cytochrome P450 n=1 Tax=Leptolyngbya sp. NK1-12 TaxID=2547451 RepID=A0AA96WJJ9_9CYAN|nr:cytochrome P450 [Leptolyngbya sp. NK1-12]
MKLTPGEKLQSNGFKPSAFPPVKHEHQLSAFYAFMRCVSPLVYDQRLDVWAVYDYATARRILTDTAHFSSDLSRVRFPRFLHKDLHLSILHKDPPIHTALRGSVQRFFTPSFLAGFTGFIDTFVQKCLERSTDRGYCDIVEHVASPLALTCALMLLGFPEAEWPQIGRWWSLRKAHSRTRQQYTSLFSELWSADFDIYLRSKIDEKFHQPGDDVLSAIIQTHLNSVPLNEQEIIEFVILILVASQDTTAQLVANSVLCLLQYEDVRNKLSRDLGLLKPFLEEVLRYTSPVQGVSRVPTCDVAIDRAILHAGQEVIVWIGSANRDESIFERAAEFDLDRKPNPHLAFGMGIHYCLGAALSSLATQAVLRQLLQSFPHFQLANQPPLRWSSNPFLSGPAQLPLQLTK